MHTPLCWPQFDGTLAQSEGLHRLAFSEVLGSEIDEDEWVSKCVGTSPAKLMSERLSRPLANGETIDDLLAQRSQIFERFIDEGRLDETQGATKLLRELGQRRVRCAIVSSGSRSYILKALHRLGIADAFETIVAGDDAVVGSNHKPHPFPYLHAAERLGVRPDACVAFEDSISGVRSAQAAGMRVVAVRNLGTENLVSVSHGALPQSRTVDGSTEALLPVLALVSNFDELDREVLFE